MTQEHADCLESLAADGFVRIPQFVAGEEFTELIANVDRFIAEVVPRLPPEHVFYEDKREPASLKQIQHMELHDARFRELLCGGRFLEIAERVLGGGVVAKNLQYFNKPPGGAGKPTPPHQDGYYFMLNPCEAVTMWFALDDVDEHNGCVRYVRGSHQRGMRQHTRTKTLGFSQGIADYPTNDDETFEIAVPARAGDLMIHDAMTIHRADGNQSLSRSRRALGLMYYGRRAREDTVAHSAYQRKLAREMRIEGKI